MTTRTCRRSGSSPAAARAGPGEVAIDSVSATKGGSAVGDQVRLVTPDGAKTGDAGRHLPLRQRRATSPGATIAAFDLPTAQDLLLGGTRGFTEIDAVADRGVSQQTGG